MPHKRKNKGKKRKDPKQLSGNKALIYRGPNIMPSRFTAVLRFSSQYQLANSTVKYANNRYTPTSCYDVDPFLGSTSMPGFTELGALYRKYRMRRYHIKVTASNMETFPGLLWICPTNVDPGANTSSYANFLSNPRSKQVMLGPTNGASSKTLQDSVSLEDFAGVTTHQALDDLYSALMTNVPSNNLYHAVGFVCPNNQTASGGIYYDVVIDIEIDFYEVVAPAA